ncbi:hypothetical protein DFR65_1131 [Oceanihabitans sediminis]|uniref:Uncharacterized protein n=1 Tax=Oceanihabitans sediminis TaxID=1812012 RepID=A0A368P3F3_9FLAO|nr:hypothetical protein [Oceanihabitans sediminis]RBP26931.1 hypothetical protein DFR65_1131 [Oceanihabitans sediminis]RCU56973.1 hypothetical protein DU428_08465 [Oceanihabitans sediminis]
MAKKKREKEKKETSSLKKIGYILLFALPLFVLIYFNGQNRQEKLKNDSFTTYGIIEKLLPNSSKGTTTRKDVVYFYFVKNDTVFHKIKDLTENGIKRLGIKINDCYEVKVVKSDYGIFDIDFKKRKDTLIDKKNYKNQIYNTFIHKNIIE